MLDFTSALYLGMRHPADRLAPWDSLSLGKPAALREPPGAQALAADLAALQGCEAACLLPSTLHLFWDLFGMLAGERLVILADGASYAIARWGAERAQALGLPLQVFPSGEVALLRRLAAGWRHRTGRRPLILADGYVPGSDRAPPLAAYAAIAQQGGGHVLLDDTQVLGVSGAQGGGSARLHGLQGEALIIGASLRTARRACTPVRPRRPCWRRRGAPWRSMRAMAMPCAPGWRTGWRNGGRAWRRPASLAGAAPSPCSACRAVPACSRACARPACWRWRKRGDRRGH